MIDAKEAERLICLLEADEHTDNCQLRDYIRQLRRALWLARAERAFAEMEKYETEAMMWKGRDDKIHKWHNVYRKCRAMADKYAPITTYHNLAGSSNDTK